MGDFLNLNKGVSWLPDSYYNTFNNLNHVSPALLPYTPQLNTNLPQKLNIDFNNQKANSTKKSNLTGSILALTGQVATDYLSDVVTKGLDDSEFGRALGNIFSSGINSAGNTIIDNVIKGLSLATGLGKNVGASVVGTGAGLASNLIGQGITSLGGDSRLSRGIGLGVATGLGTVGGTVLSNLILFGNIAGKADKLFGTMDAATKAAKIAKLTAQGKSAEEAASIVGKSGAINPYGLAASVAGMALGAATGPSKEYGGRYGNITKYMDLGYDALATGINFVPGWGQLASGLMQLNKGLSNVFGSTSGMTMQDAILGSAFMPAPVKWLNMAGAKTTDDFYRQSFQNLQKATTFMLNGFGNLNLRFDLAREESGKTYGTFSRGAYRKALNNIDFANNAWGTIMNMADQNELQKVRSLYMTTINDQRYAQMIGGGYNPIYIGKQGMKILNNATNHNIAMRLLSGAALIDNKQMILSAQGETKVRRPARPLPRKPATREENPELWDEWERRDAERNASKQRVYLLEREAATQRAEANARYALHYSNLATGVAETVLQNALFEPITQESLQNSNTEQLRQELLADKDEYFDNGMKFIEAAGIADLGVNVAGPIFQRGFRWAFNKAGLLVRVPKLSELFSLNLSSEKFINPDGSINVLEAVPEIVRGKNFAIEYLNSPTRTAVNTHNKELANRLGFKLFRPFNEAGQRVSTPSNLKIVRENSSIGGSVSTDSKNPAADLVTINLYNSDPYYASMHENLHRGYLGNAPKEYFLNETRGTFGDTNRFYDYLKDKLLKPWSERYNLPGADYLDLSAELAVNMFEVGQRMGLKVGLKFPGNLKVLELLEKYKNSGDYKSGVIDHLNLKHPLRIWKALTGTLFSVPLIYGTVNNTIGLKAK